MEFTISQQGVCFMWSIACGGVIALIYDVFRLMRLFFLKGKVATFVCDFLFMVLAALVSVVFSIGFSRGNTRYFIIIGETLGFLSYRFTLGRLSIGVFEFIFGKISVFFRKSADKIRKTGKKVLQVTSTVLYNIIRKRILPVSKLIFRKGRRCHETTEKTK